jgi:hypothetical protein
VTPGGVAAAEADLLFGETLAPHFSVFAVATGFGDDGLVTLESAWARVNDVGGSSWLNFKIGRLELDLPRSEHRSYTLTAPYLIYHHQPTGSTNGSRWATTSSASRSWVTATVPAACATRSRCSAWAAIRAATARSRRPQSTAT